MSHPSFVDVHCGFGRTVTAPDWGTSESVREFLTLRGIGKAFLYSSAAREYDPVEGNDLLADKAVGFVSPDGSGLDLRGWLVAHPARPEDAQRQMKQYLLSDRFVGMALYPDPLTGIPVTARGAAEVVTSFRRYSKVLLVHTPSAEAMREVVQLARDYNGVRIIASGMGGMEWREAIEMAAKPLNLFLDISGTLEPGKIDYAVSETGGVRKLLFASGAPETDPAAVLAMLFEADLTEDDRAKVLYANAGRIFGFAVTDEEEVADLAPMGG